MKVQHQDTMISKEEILMQQIDILKQKNQAYQKYQKIIESQKEQGIETLQDFTDLVGKVDKHTQDDKSTEGSEQGSGSNLEDFTENLEDGQKYYNRLVKEFELGHRPFQFLDRNILKHLSFELRGQKRVVAIMYYISWACSVKFRGILSHIKGLWQGFKQLIDGLMNWLKQKLQWIWEKIKGSWDYIMGN